VLENSLSTVTSTSLATLTRSSNWPPFSGTTDEALTSFTSPLAPDGLRIWTDNKTTNAEQPFGYLELSPSSGLLIALESKQVHLSSNALYPGWDDVSNDSQLAVVILIQLSDHDGIPQNEHVDGLASAILAEHMNYANPFAVFYFEGFSSDFILHASSDYSLQPPASRSIPALTSKRLSRWLVALGSFLLNMIYDVGSSKTA